MKECFAFVLPTGGERQFGGFKVVYEYANRLYEDGFDIIIFYCFPSKNRKRGSLYNLIKKGYYFIKYFIFRNYKPNKWFDLKKGIIQKLIASTESGVRIKDFKHVDYVCATGIETSFYIDKIDSIRNEKKFYLIQSFETWVGVSDEYVMMSFKLPLTKIVISPFLKDKVLEAGHESYLIPNGFDFGYFKLTNSIENRNPYHVAMLYHTMEVKRCSDAIEALKIVKSIFPELIVNIFGFPARPKDLPEWFHYYQCPDKETHNFVYNDSAIFIAASRIEGMALPPAEAMICGCALACTNIPGFTQYAIDKKTALLSDVFDIQGLAKNICSLIENNEERIKIAKEGNEFIQCFTWEKAYKNFRSVIKK